MEEYTKINTLFKRDMANKGKIIEWDWALPEFEYLKHNTWIFTEKVDGTNIRISTYLEPTEDTPPNQLKIGGRTDNAQIPTKLLDAINKLIPVEKFKEIFPIENNKVTLYGEGYGAGIQSGGKYRITPSFVLFDVKIGEWWLKREDIQDIASKLAIEIVPVIGEGSLFNAVNLVKDGLKSLYGEFIAEGLVLKPKTELKSRAGHRIIGKIKHRDFHGGK